MEVLKFVVFKITIKYEMSNVFSIFIISPFFGDNHWCQLLSFQVFFYKGCFTGGMVHLGSHYQDYVWVTREEMKDYLQPDYYKTVKRFVRWTTWNCNCVIYYIHGWETPAYTPHPWGETCFPCQRRDGSLKYRL